MLINSWLKTFFQRLSVSRHARPRLGQKRCGQSWIPASVDVLEERALLSGVSILSFSASPVIDAFDTAISYSENDAGVVLDPDATVVDIDSVNFDTGRLTVALTANAVSTDRLELRHQGAAAGEIGVNAAEVTYGGTAIGTFVGGAGSRPLVVTLNAQATPESVQALLRNVTFRNASDNPTALTRTVRVSLTDGDGGTSNLPTKTIDVAVANDPPVIGAFDTAARYTENAAAVSLDSNAMVIDPDSPSFDAGRLTVTLTANGVDADRLELRHQGTAAGQIGVSGTEVMYGGTTIGTFSGGVGTDALVVTLNANATAGATQALLRNVTYRTISETPSTLPRTVEVALTDGDGGTSNPSAKTINVLAVNDRPVIDAFDTAISYSENDGGVVLDPDATVSDIDSADFDTGRLTVALTANAVSTDRLEIRHQGTAAGEIGVNSAEVTYGGTAIGTFAGGAGSRPLVVTLNANATAESVQALLRNVTFRNASDNPTTLTRTVRVSLTDGDGGTSNLPTKTIDVGVANDPPVIGAFDTAVSYRENALPVLLDSNATVADPDSSNFDTGALTVTLTANAVSEDRLEIRHQGVATGQIGVSGTEVLYGGTTIGSFSGGVGTDPLVVTLNANATVVATQALLRNVTYRTISETPSTLPRTVEVALTDGDGGTSSLSAKTINVLAVNDRPVIDAFDTAISYSENDGGVVLDPDATVVDIDSVNFDTGRLTVALTANGVSTDRLELRHQGTAAGEIGVNSAEVTYGGTAIGTFVGGAGSRPLVVTLNAQATPESVQALLRNVTFRNASDNPTALTRTVRVSLTDGDGGTSNLPTKTIDVAVANDPPVIAPIADRIHVASKGVFRLPISASDPEKSLVTWVASTSDVPGATLQIDGKWLSVLPPTGFYGTLPVHLSATDGTSDSELTFNLYVIRGAFRNGEYLEINGLPTSDATLVRQVGEKIEVRMGFTPASVDPANKPAATFLFDRASIRQIVWRGFEGDDWFTNQTDLSSMAVGDSGNDILVGGAGADLLYGGAGRDEIHGGDGDDLLYGGTDTDQVHGDAGDDILTGGLGADFLDGGPGADFLVGEDNYQSPVNLSDTYLSGDDNDTVVGATAVTAPPGQLVVPSDPGLALTGTNTLMIDFQVVYRDPADWSTAQRAAVDATLAILEKSFVASYVGETITIEMGWGPIPDGEFKVDTLAHARPTSFYEISDVAYPVSLANHVRRSDMNGSSPEITVGVRNSGLLNWTDSLGNPISGSDFWDFSGSTTTGTFVPYQVTTTGIQPVNGWSDASRTIPKVESRSDFITVLLHEVTHGLGFTANASVTVERVRRAATFQPTMEYVRNVFPDIGDDIRVNMGSSFLNLPDVFFRLIDQSSNEWTGANGRGASPTLAPLIDYDAKDKKFTGHTDETRHRTELMSPRLAWGEVIRSYSNLERGMLADLGWTVIRGLTNINQLPSTWNNATSMTTLGNDIFVIQADRLHRVDANGQWSFVGDANWSGPTEMTALNGWLYVIQADRLHRVDSTTGAFDVISEAVWSGTTSLTTLDGKLYAIQADTLHAIDITAMREWSTYEYVGTSDWSGVTAAATLGGNSYIIQNATLHRITESGTVTKLGSDRAWPGPVKMTSLGSWLYVIQADRLHRVNPENGAYEIISDPVWGGTTSMSAAVDRLLIVQNNRLHTVDPYATTPWSTFTIAGTGVWDGPTAMTQLGGVLYVVQNSRLYRVNQDGSYAVLGTGVWDGAVVMTSLGSNLYIIQNGRLHRVTTAGAYTVLNNTDWSGATSMSSLNGFLYVIQANRLHRVTTSGSYVVLGGESWSGYTSMTSLGSYLYVIQDSALWRVAGDGTYQRHGSASWGGTAFVTAQNGWLFIIQDGRLYRVDPTNGNHTALSYSGTWNGTTSMSATGGYVFAIQANRFHRVDVSATLPWSTYSVVGVSNWDGATAAANWGTSAYIVQNGTLHRVTRDGSKTILGDVGDWGGDVTMTAAGDWLYIVQNGILHRVDPNTGRWIQISGTSWNGTTSLATAGTHLMAVQADRLHRVNVFANRDWSSFTRLPGTWDGDTSMTSMDGLLYITQANKLHSVTPGGQITILGTGTWQAPTSMTVMNNILYVIENGYLHRVGTDGSYLAIDPQLFFGPTLMTSLNGHLYVIYNGKLLRVSP